MIGAVGQQTRGVEKILRRVGFRYAERVDPFDGGPHFIARTDDVSLVRAVRRVELAQDPGMHPAERYLVARRTQNTPYFAAMAVQGEYRDARTLVLSEEACAHFAALPQGSTWALPLGPV